MSTSNRLFLFALSLIIIGCDSAKVITVSSDRPQEQPDFQVEYCNLTYQDKSLTFGVSVDEWVAVMGSFDHRHELANDVYVWDNLGVTLYAMPGTDKVRSLNFEFDNKLPFSEQDITASKATGMDALKRQINAAKPKRKFDSVVRINGAEISGNWNLSTAQTQMYQYDPKANSVFDHGYSPTNFATYIRCPLDKYPSYKNREMIFRVDTQADDVKKTRVFSIGIKLTDQ